MQFITDIATAVCNLAKNLKQILEFYLGNMGDQNLMRGESHLKRLSNIYVRMMKNKLLSLNYNDMKKKVSSLILYLTSVMRGQVYHYLFIFA